MKKKIGAVIVAAGYGMIRPGVSKLFESVTPEGVSMLSRVCRIVYDAQVFPIVFVRNPRWGEEMWDVLARDAPHVLQLAYPAIQQERCGAADAVRSALRLLELTHCTDFLVIYGDMPLWRPTTLARLVDLHRREEPAISMVSVKIDGATSPRSLERYGRVLRDESGRIVKVVEPGDTTNEDVRRVRTVNPSLYVFNRSWFNWASLLVEPRPRPDGFSSERHLPPLVEIADKLNNVWHEPSKVVELPIDDPEEALGVNTAEELEEVRRIFRKRAQADRQAQAAASATE